ncbi:MAG: hypothetical protein K0R68_2312 [Mycobacterium sp.]|nr:hypothetical protein [Mycobacterium sp.]
MARRMDYVVSFDAPAEKIYQDFTDREFWEALMGVYRSLKTDSTLTSFTSDPSGTDIEFRQVLPRTELPPVARAVMPVDMVVTREQHFDPYDLAANRAEGTYRASIPAGLGHFGGRYVLTETTSGSELRLATVCKVKIPLVGGTLEQLILSNVTGLFDAEGAFMSDWVARHH